MRAINALTVTLAMLAVFGVLAGCNLQPGEVQSEAPQDVAVQTDNREYATGEEITVTVTNNIDALVVTYDQQAFCSILRLERQGQAGWEEVRNCYSLKPEQFVGIEPHTVAVVELPGIPAPGTYHIAVVFSEDSFSFDRVKFAVSEPFDVIDIDR